MEPRALKPLSSGVIVIAGIKASNLSNELRNHPRIVMWDSQNEHWHGKDLPTNARVVFMTRFIGHSAFDNIVSQARKRQITIFNPEGTGMIVKQVKQLLNIDQPLPVIEMNERTIVAETQEKNKLKVLHEFIDFHKSNVENADILLEKAKELGISSTRQSLANMVGLLRRKASGFKPVVREKKQDREPDIAVQMFDNIIQELKDMRQFFIQTVNENIQLRKKLEKFKKALSDDE